MSSQAPIQLEGARVLVVEDRAPIVMELCDMLADHGCVVVGPAGRLSHAMALVDEPMDAALLDIDLYGEPSYPVARALQQRGVPIMLLTGFDEQSVPQELRGAPVLEKPIAAAQLLRVLSDQVRGRADVP